MNTPKSQNRKQSATKRGNAALSPVDLQFEVKQYFLKLDSRGGKYAGGDDVRYQYPTISLSEDPMNTEPTTAIAYFYPDGYNMPAASRATGKEFYLHYHISQLPQIMEILQTPGRVFCAYRVQTNLVWAYLQGPAVTRSLTGRMKR